MKSSTRYPVIISILFCTLLTCMRPVYAGHAADAADAADGAGEYGFGVVPQFVQRKLFRIWRPILNELDSFFYQEP
jgi:hypothetical protein